MARAGRWFSRSRAFPRAASSSRSTFLPTRSRSRIERELHRARDVAHARVKSRHALAIRDQRARLDEVFVRRDLERRCLVRSRPARAQPQALSPQLFHAEFGQDIEEREGFGWTLDEPLDRRLETGKTREWK